MYHFIINPQSRSGKGLQIWKTVKEELDKKEVTYSFHITEGSSHATRLTREICVSYPGMKNIVVLGGDGTVNEVINGISNLDEVILGYIPSGSSNDLARSLKLPKDPLTGLNNILSLSRFQYIDIGQIKDHHSDFKRYFMVSTGIGFDAAICEETFRSRLKKVLNSLGIGKLTYILIALKQLFACKFINGTITPDKGEPINLQKILMVTSMIHKYEGGGMKIAPAADPYDGQLSVCVVHGLSKLRIFFTLPTLLIGKHIHFKGVTTFNCRSLDIKVDQPAWIHNDGECPGKYKGLSVTCLAGQLKIVA
ncbi:MAG: DAGKc domain-containing protein [Lachnoclostridium sp.]|jgi:YegS/Rv2252/BmrU family lipid kinase